MRNDNPADRRTVNRSASLARRISRRRYFRLLRGYVGHGLVMVATSGYADRTARLPHFSAAPGARYSTRLSAQAVPTPSARRNCAARNQAVPGHGTTCAPNDLGTGPSPLFGIQIHARYIAVRDEWPPRRTGRAVWRPGRRITGAARPPPERPVQWPIPAG